jgi:hypothetical protein
MFLSVRAEKFMAESIAINLRFPVSLFAFTQKCFLANALPE